MPAATNKSDLIAVTVKEFDKLVGLLKPLSEEVACWESPDDHCSVREVIAHRAHWIGLYLSWYEDGCAGVDVQTPASGYKWNQLKAYNAQIYATAKDYQWSEILDNFLDKHALLMSHLEELEDGTLYTQHLYPWMNDWTLGRWAEASGASHYRSAGKFVRKVLRGSKAASG